MSDRRVLVVVGLLYPQDHRLDVPAEEPTSSTSDHAWDTTVSCPPPNRPGGKSNQSGDFFNVEVVLTGTSTLQSKRLPKYTASEVTELPIPVVKRGDDH